MVTRVQLEGDIDLSGANAPAETPVTETPAPQPEAQAPAETPAPTTPTIPVPRDPALPDNFQSVADLRAAYLESQRKITELSQTAKPATPPPTQTPGPTNLELERYSQEFNTFGRLSEDSIRALEAKGIPRNFTQQYVEGVAASQANQLRRGHELVGGADQYQAMSSWAASNLSAGELHAFNSQVTNGDQGTRDFAIKSLAARWRSEAGQAPSFVRGMGNTGGGGGIQPFASEAEMTKAINDPRYQEDAGYRQQVERRIARTDF